MNTVLINETSSGAASETVHVKLDALLDNVRVPGTVTCLTAENESDAGIEELDSLCPLVGLLCVVFLCHLADLPWSPHLVSESPVLDLYTMSVSEIRRRAREFTL